MIKVCSIEGCGNKHSSRGWCAKHYHRWQRYRDPLVTRQSPKGDMLNWIIENSKHVGEKCLAWPFAKTMRTGSLVRWRGKGTLPTRIMCTIAHGEPPTPKHEASHVCGKAHEGCINPSHLIWETHIENMHRMFGHGTVTRGEKHGLSKLTQSQVLEIRRIWAIEKLSVTKIAEKFGIKHQCVSKIVYRQRWAWLPDETTPHTASNSQMVE